MYLKLSMGLGDDKTEYARTGLCTAGAAAVLVMALYMLQVHSTLDTLDTLDFLRTVVHSSFSSGSTDYRNQFTFFFTRTQPRHVSEQ